MPTNKLSEFIHRLESLEAKVDQHLHDGIDVKTDIAELKTSQKFLVKAFWIMVAAMVTCAGSLAVYVLQNVVKHG